MNVERDGTMLKINMLDAPFWLREDKAIELADAIYQAAGKGARWEPVEDGWEHTDGDGRTIAFEVGNKFDGPALQITDHYDGVEYYAATNLPDDIRPCRLVTGTQEG